MAKKQDVNELYNPGGTLYNIDSVLEIIDPINSNSTTTITAKNGFTITSKIEGGGFSNEQTSYIFTGTVPINKPTPIATIEIEAKTGKYITRSPYLKSNFKKERPVLGINDNFCKDKISSFPLSADGFPDAFPFELPDKKILVFNHRWAKSTGVNRMMEYTQDLPDYKVWCTDYQAPEEYVGSKLNSGQYRYLLENSLASMCFVDNYATWNLSIQDGLSVNKPVLIYDQPAMRKVVGDNYPLFFKTKDEFQTQVKNLKNMNNFTWEVKNHDKVFHHNLLYNMKKIMDKERKHIPKDAMNWLYCILNGINYKHDIAKQVQPNIQLNSVWQYIRRYLLEIGVKDDINSPYVNYSIPDKIRDKVEDMVKDVELEIQPTTIKRKIVTKKHNWF